MKTIALCLNLPTDAYFYPEIGKDYPGAGWLPKFKRLAAENDIQALPGRLISDAPYLDPKDIIVIQEENNEHGQKLVSRGADARVLFCMESPIYASSFYDSLGSSSEVEQSAVNRSVTGSTPVFPANFKHRLLFSGGTEHLYFPSFDESDLKDPIPCNDRKFLCMVMSNKHYSSLPAAKSKSRYMALDTQLHDYRYQAIDHFRKCGGFDLYGRGWGSFAPECADKLETIRNYKFALCFENGAYPGYVTEKIIDCLVAGVIPIYYGSPDIKERIEPRAFIDATDFHSFKDMENKLRKFPVLAANWMVQEGQDWIRSEKGNRYRCDSFAKRMMELCA